MAVYNEFLNLMGASGAEKAIIIKQGSGCSGWLFGLGRLLGFKPVEQASLIPATKPSVESHIKCVDPATFKYKDPSSVPSQPEYKQQHGGNKKTGYGGHSFFG